MGIQTTIEISREQATARINNILVLVKGRNYKALEEITQEPDYNLQKFVDRESCPNLPIICTHHWANSMLEDKLDTPFFRFSLFENYIVTGI